jgi:copper chaperone CopZ
MLKHTPRTFVGATTFHLDGMTGEHCGLAVTQEIIRLNGIDQITVDSASGTVTVVASQPVDRADIAAALGMVGHVLRP